MGFFSQSPAPRGDAGLFIGQDELWQGQSTDWSEGDGEEEMPHGIPSTADLDSREIQVVPSEAHGDQDGRARKQNERHVNGHEASQRRDDNQDAKTEAVLGDAIVILSALPEDKVRRAYERLMDELLGPDGSAPEPALTEVEGGAS